MPKEIARLTLPKAVMRRLESFGVYCQIWVTVKRPARSDRWVLRGVESGGSTKEIGRYVSSSRRTVVVSLGCKSWIEWALTECMPWSSVQS